jgi:hypothetical protein
VPNFLLFSRENEKIANFHGILEHLRGRTFNLLNSPRVRICFIAPVRPLLTCYDTSATAGAKRRMGCRREVAGFPDIPKPASHAIGSATLPAALSLVGDTPTAAVVQRQPKARFAQPELLLRPRYSSVEFQRKLRTGTSNRPTPTLL